jgi:hypothetical protein
MIQPIQEATARRRSPDGSEFRNKFPYFSESAIENKSFQQLKVCCDNIQVHLYYIYSFFYVHLTVFFLF